MGKEVKLEVLLLLIAGVVITWLFLENQEKKVLINDLKKQLDENEIFSEEIKKRLKELIDLNPDIDDDISRELSQIAVLIEVKQETKAILGLAKIIENLLKKIYKDDIKFKEYLQNLKKTRPVFADYLEFAKQNELISKEDYHLVTVLKIIRNEEAHQLGIEKDKNKIVACFLSGLGFAFTLHRLLKKTKKEI